ncbi:cytochrome b [Pseudomonas sp. Fl5BN2]|uniref:cytochrome b n=1 Tax=unclassified Pseudomonas TaxID=196821 RepID=UPI001377BA16|nr:MULTISPECIES: cytochrome b/b6 domain-containing protein [unclassified Pseudomonas]NBF03464.1 cytochrome b [Pseudomonas sp. Fl5BN2]NBF10995.1 cytochrome b [Pseudomonas sp. Fl4BN1]
MESRIELYDSQARYGVVSRGLHWAMALAFVWIYSTTGAHYLLADSALDEFLWPTHKQVGLLLMGLLLVRVVWALLNRHRRPPSLNLAATLGHGLLYAGMFAIPFLGLLRQFGSGRAFTAFGLPIMNGFEGPKIQWMTDLGNSFHSLLGWTLLVLIVGHIGAVILHCGKGQWEVLRRMAGRAARA